MTSFTDLAAVEAVRIHSRNHQPKTISVTLIFSKMLTSIALFLLLIIPKTFARKSNRYQRPDTKNRGKKTNGGDMDDNLICPFILEGTPISGNDPTVPDLDTYNQALLDLNINDVFQDIVDLLTDSQECWPADTLGGATNYGGLFIRLAWHCSGTFRSTDGAGGCAGGRERYPPEASWDDNTNLDKARALLYPLNKNMEML